MTDLRKMASEAFEEAAASGGLPALGREAVSEMARDMAGGDEAVYGAAMDEFDTQDILSSRRAMMDDDAAVDDEMHAETRDAMARSLGLTGAEVSRAGADAEAGDTSPLLSMKEAFVFG